MAAAAHDPALFYAPEAALRASMGYPPFGRLANIIVRGRSQSTVAAHAQVVASALADSLPRGFHVLGPSPCPIGRLKGVWRWHVLVKAPEDSEISRLLGKTLTTISTHRDVAVGVDVDPVDLL